MKEFFKLYCNILLAIFIFIITITYLWFVFFPKIITLFPSGGLDWLSFWGSFLSFFSSVIFGLVIVWQNNKLWTMNDDKDKYYKYIELEKTRLENIPLIAINTYNINNIISKDKDGNNIHILDENNICYLDRNILKFEINKGCIKYCINDDFVINIKQYYSSFALYNCGNNTANNINIKIKYKNSTAYHPHIQSLPKNKEQYFYINYYDPDYENLIYLDVTYKDIFQNEYKQTFVIVANYDNEILNMICQHETQQIIINRSDLFKYKEI